MATQKSSMSAKYASTSSSHEFSKPLPSLSSNASSLQERTSYLSALRSGVTEMQNDINVFLTQKMEDDKAAELAAGKRAGAGKKEEREEEMYGEEDVEAEG